MDKKEKNIIFFEKKVKNVKKKEEDVKPPAYNTDGRTATRCISDISYILYLIPNS